MSDERRELEIIVIALARISGLDLSQPDGARQMMRAILEHTETGNTVQEIADLYQACLDIARLVRERGLGGL